MLEFEIGWLDPEPDNIPMCHSIGLGLCQSHSHSYSNIQKMHQMHQKNENNLFIDSQ